MMRKREWRRIGLLGMLMFWSASVAAQPADWVGRDSVQAVLDAFRETSGVPGATAGVVLADGTAFGFASGVAERGSARPMHPTDRLMQGSVGKTYVVAVALQLVAEDRLDLDALIARYLGDEPWFDRLPNARAITVRMLMNHTSGLVRYELNEAFLRDLTADPQKVWTPEEELAYLFDQEAPFPAGEGWDYSDTNYIVLGMIIERITGQPYHTTLRGRLLDPLGLADTVPVEGPVVPGLVQGYAGADNPFGGSDAMIRDGVFVINPQFEWTGGGIASTTKDLARWAKLLYEGRAFDPALLPQMFDGVPARLGPGVRYGLGVILRETPLGPAYGHSGFFPGYMTEVLYFPDHQTAVALQVNTSVFQTLKEPLHRSVVRLGEAVLRP